MTVKMNAMQAKLNHFYLATMKPTRTKRKFYCWSCGIKFTRGSKKPIGQEIDPQGRFILKEATGLERELVRMVIRGDS